MELVTGTLAGFFMVTLWLLHLSNNRIEVLKRELGKDSTL